MTEYQILTDAEVRGWLTMDRAIGVMEEALHLLAEGKLFAPPRLRVGQAPGQLVFTVGGSAETAVGFRVYDTFPQQAKRWDQRQIVVVYDGTDGQLKGLIIGRLLGAMRTGALGGVALRYLARQDARRLAVIGSGFQARTQVAAALAVRPIESVRIYSRTKAHAAAFADELTDRYSVSVQVAPAAREAVIWADIVLCATDSRRPVLDTRWLRPGVHVSTIGPRMRGAQELPSEVATACDLVASDSLAQIQALDPDYFIDDVSQIAALADIVSGRRGGRPSPDAVTLFCSVGLAGTEVLLGDRLLQLVDAG
ncbi:MAG: ornithine cyclodeaminase family protein [Candidatus Promineifilaceae bacterium]|nr:ornithine cyclodeaminase family protein [Candidatus Promineifilaceae bacterium]